MSGVLREVAARAVILRLGKPVARFVPVRALARPRVRAARVLGADRDVLIVLDDFDAPLPESVLDDFRR